MAFFRTRSPRALRHVASLSPPPSLVVAGLDSNCIGELGLCALASALSLGAVPALRKLFVDLPEHEILRDACVGRPIECSAW